MQPQEYCRQRQERFGSGSLILLVSPRLHPTPRGDHNSSGSRTRRSRSSRLSAVAVPQHLRRNSSLPGLPPPWSGRSGRSARSARSDTYDGSEQHWHQIGPSPTPPPTARSMGGAPCADTASSPDSPVAFYEEDPVSFLILGDVGETIVEQQTPPESPVRSCDEDDKERDEEKKEENVFEDREEKKSNDEMEVGMEKTEMELASLDAIENGLQEETTTELTLKHNMIEETMESFIRGTEQKVDDVESFLSGVAKEESAVSTLFDIETFLNGTCEEEKSDDLRAWEHEKVDIESFLTGTEQQIGEKEVDIESFLKRPEQESVRNGVCDGIMVDLPYATLRDVGAGKLDQVMAAAANAKNGHMREDSPPLSGVDALRRDFHCRRFNHRWTRARSSAESSPPPEEEDTKCARFSSALSRKSTTDLCDSARSTYLSSQLSSSHSGAFSAIEEGLSPINQTLTRHTKRSNTWSFDS